MRAELFVTHSKMIGNALFQMSGVSMTAFAADLAAWLVAFAADLAAWLVALPIFLNRPLCLCCLRLA